MSTTQQGIGHQLQRPVLRSTGEVRRPQVGEWYLCTLCKEAELCKSPDLCTPGVIFEVVAEKPQVPLVEFVGFPDDVPSTPARAAKLLPLIGAGALSGCSINVLSGLRQEILNRDMVLHLPWVVRAIDFALTLDHRALTSLGTVDRLAVEDVVRALGQGPQMESLSSNSQKCGTQGEQA